MGTLAENATDNELMEAALAYASAGVAVFPLKPRSKEPSVKHGVKDCTTDPEVIRRWWTQHPQDNVAIACGAPSGGLVVIDLDVHPDEGIDGEAALREWENEHGELPDAPRSLTGSGGVHLLYRAPEGMEVGNHVNKAEGVDIRATGGYIVAPPSVHPNGNRYEWEFDPEEYPLATADGNVMDFIAHVAPTRDRRETFAAPGTIDSGGRNDTLYRYACSLQAKGASDETISDTIHGANQTRCKPPLDTSEVEQILSSALALEKGKPRIDGELSASDGALDGEAVFAVGGIFEQRAVEAAGYPVVSLSGMKPSKLAELLAEREPRPTVITLFARDSWGRHYDSALTEACADRFVTVRPVVAPVELEGNDADEWSRTSPEAFRAFLSRAFDTAVQQRQEDENARFTAGMEAKGIKPMAAIARAIADGTETARFTPTGLAFIDDNLGGGLPEGITVLAAPSSTGKTTLLVHMADNIAASGRPVLFVSIEQRAPELAAMSLSRLAYGQGYSMSRTEVRDAEGRTPERVGHLREAVAEYEKAIAPNLYVYSGLERPGVADVDEVAKTIKRHRGVAPVVMIDYLQLLKAENDRDGDKTALDKHMTGLRRLSGELKTPVVCLSSIAREHYNRDLDMSANKDSGGIEFGADVVAVMQAEGVHRIATDNNDLKPSRIKARNAKVAQMADKPLELKILKNRNGKRHMTPIPFYIDVEHNEAHGKGKSKSLADKLADIPVE